MRPGDIKYKDVNGDGVINDDDIVPLSYSNTPTLQYGFAAEFRYKQFTASIFFEGVGKVQYFYGVQDTIRLLGKREAMYLTLWLIKRTAGYRENIPVTPVRKIRTHVFRV